jgi:hypothetical protein
VPADQVATGRLKRTRAPPGLSASQIRPPWASTIARDGAGPSPVEGAEHALALLGRDADAAVGDLHLDPGVDRLGADDDAAVGRGVADGVLDQIEEDALELLGIGARRLQAVGHARRHEDALGLGLEAHRLDGLPHELAQRDALERPVDVAGL